MLNEYISTDTLLKVLGMITPLLTVIIGVWQFNKGQKLIKEKEIEQRKFEINKLNQQYTAENLKKFKENQSQLYNETARVISFLANSKNIEAPEYESKIQRFRELYWVELASVESREVAARMVKIGQYVEKLEECIETSQNAKEIQKKLNIEGLNLAGIIKKEFQNWEYPEFIKKALEQQISGTKEPIKSEKLAAPVK